MKFVILAYNPKYILLRHITDLVSDIFRAHSCPVHAIEHNDDSSAPIFSVEVVDTDPVEEE